MLLKTIRGCRHLGRLSSSVLLFFSLALFLTLVLAVKDLSSDTEWTDGESRVLMGAESEIDNIIYKVSSKNEAGKMQQLRKFPLQNLHFQTQQGIYVTLTDLEGTLTNGVEVTETATSLRDRRTRLHLLVSLVEVKGRSLLEVSSYENRQKDVTANFSLTLKNVTGKGLATLNINPSTSAIYVSRVMVDYEFGPSHMTITQDRDGTKLSDFLHGSYFKDIVVKKIWRDLSFQLNSVVKREMATALARYESRGSQAQSLRTEGVAQKLQQGEVNNTQSANKMLDQIIVASRGILVDRFEDRIPIPDIEHYFGRTILYVLPLRGQFLADQGTARGLSTAYRDGDTAYSKQNRTTHFYGGIAFTDLNLYYNHYEAKFVGIGPTGILNTKLQPITVQVHIHIDWATRKIFLDEFKVTHLGDLQVEITGLSVFNWLFSKITTWVVGWVRDKVVGQLETTYQGYIRDVLSDVNVDDLITGRAFKNK